MTGDQDDIVSRLHRWLPTGWFPTSKEEAPRVYSILSGFAELLRAIYEAISYLRLQTRLGTTSDGFLDLASRDYLGTLLPRLPGEPDSGFVLRIRREIVRERLTRNAIDALLFEMTGYHPEITEPERANDLFAWRGRYGWRTGHLGSRAWRPAVFIKTTHAGVFGIDLAAWRKPTTAWRTPHMVWQHESMIVGTGFTDQQILDALNRIRAAGVTYWVWIADLPPTLLADELGNLIMTEDGLAIAV